MLVVNFNPFPVLVTERLILRQITPDDLPRLFQLRSDEQVMKYIDRPLAKSIDDAAELLQKIDTALAANDGITWAVTLKNDPLLAGTLGFWRLIKEHYRAEIGYMLHTAYQGQGIMQEAIAAALQYGFQSMKLHSVEANVNPGNEASVKLLEKNNFIREAYFRENYYHDGKFLDSAIYSLLSTV